MAPMAPPVDPQPVKYLCGMIAGNTRFFDRAEEALMDILGPIDLRSEPQPFDMTTYYEAEMGPNLLRKFVAFEHLASPGRLAEIKHATNAIEAHLAAGSDLPRPINLDPGYVTTAKLVLASMKDFSHRVYLRDGVYAEVTLVYKHHQWQATPWTFPDYGSGRYDEFLSRARTCYHDQVS
jgi:hypothetical protein